MTENKKLYAKATLVRTRLPNMDMWSSGQSQDSVDKFQFPKDYYKIVELCNHYYRTDPIVSNTINKVVDVGFKGYKLSRRDCSDDEFAVYNSVTDKMILNLREMGLEYFLSGLVIPDVTWMKARGSELHPELPSDTWYQVPEVLWKRDPASLKLRKTPIPNRIVVTVEAGDEDVAFIKNKGVYSDGVEDKETYEMLKDNYPEYVQAVLNGKTNFKLDDPMLIRRFPLDDSPYPTPYLIPVLQSLRHKRNLQKMDYAIAARVISAIMLIKMGSDEFPLTEDDDDLVDNLKSQMLWRNRSSNIERVFQLFTNHTVTMEWIMPDMDALLDDKKYDAVNSDILFGLGFPRILLTGETAKTGTSQSEFALLSPAETIKSTRELMLDWPRKIYAEMKDRNGFVNLPEPKFEEIRLYDLSKLFTIADTIYERGGLSKETLARLGGFDFEKEELPQRVRESDLFEALDIPEYPLMPFTNQVDDNTSDGVDNNDKTNQDS